MTIATTSKTQDVTATTGTQATKTLATKGIKAATRFMERQGYEILERNFQSKSGSVDLIVSDDDNLVFVEVKTRSNADRGLPEESTTRETRDRNEKIAVEYLSTHEVTDTAVRFDVISILVVSEDRAFLRHHINAMSLDE